MNGADGSWGNEEVDVYADTFWFSDVDKILKDINIIERKDPLEVVKAIISKEEMRSWRNFILAYCIHAYYLVNVVDSGLWNICSYV